MRNSRGRVVHIGKGGGLGLGCPRQWERSVLGGGPDTMAGRQLTKAERESWRIRLEQEMSPDEMIRSVDELKDIVWAYMHVQAGLAFVRDAWTAGRFAQARAADAVRLWPGDRPDCELMLQGRRELFEIVEADQPGRQRSAEYRDLIRRRELGEREQVEIDEDWQSRAAMAPEMLRRAAIAKAAKGYDLDNGLIIHLNLMEHGFKAREVEAAMQPCTAAAKDAFREVWVLWQNAAYPLWRNGKALPPDRRPKREDEMDRSASEAALWKSILEDD